MLPEENSLFSSQNETQQKPGQRTFPEPVADLNHRRAIRVENTPGEQAGPRATGLHSADEFKAGESEQSKGATAAHRPP